MSSPASRWLFRARLPSPTARTAVACSASFALTMLLLGLPVLFGSFYFGRDLTWLDLGKACEIQRLVSAHQSLLIAPDLGNGEPLVADPQSQVFYPLRWLLLLLPVPLGVSLSPVLHLALAAAAAAWLGRTFALRTITATGCGLAFAFSGAALDLVVHSTYVVGALTLPLAWAAGRRILQRRPGRHLPVLAFGAMALGLLGGDPQAVAIATGILSLEVLHRLRTKRLARRALGELVLPTCAGILVGLCPWMSAFAELTLTARAHGPLINPSFGSSAFEPVLWLSALVPGALDTDRSGVGLWTLIHGDEATWNLTPYLGPVFIAALLAGLGRKRLRVAAWTWALALVLSLGDLLGPVSALTRYLPVIGSFRYAEKYLVTVALAGALLAATTLQQAIHLARARKPLLGWLGVLLAANTLVLGALALSPGEGPDSTLSEMLTRSVIQCTVPLVIALGVVSLRPAWGRGWLIWLVVGDLLAAAPHFVFLGPRLDTVASPLAQLPHGAERRTRLCVSRNIRTAGTGDVDPSGWMGFLSQRKLEAPDLNACDGIVQGTSYSMLQTATNEALTARMSAGSGAAARALGCSHVILPQDSSANGLRRVSLEGLSDRVPGDRGAPALFELEDPLPEAFAISHPILAQNEDEAVRALGAAATSESALSVVDDPLHRLASPATLPSGMAIERVTQQRLDSNRVTVTATGAGGGIVGTLTSYQAGWRARQSGRELEVVRVAGSHLGAVVEDARRGPVEFVYALPNALPALILAILGSLMLLAALVKDSPRLAESPGELAPSPASVSSVRPDAGLVRPAGLRPSESEGAHPTRGDSGQAR